VLIHTISQQIITLTSRCEALSGWFEMLAVSLAIKLTAGWTSKAQSVVAVSNDLRFQSGNVGEFDSCQGNVRYFTKSGKKSFQQKVT